MAALAKVLRERRLSATARKRRWADMSGAERAMILTLGSIELALTAVAGVDLYRRQPEDIRGPKALWWPIIFVQPVGPIAYLKFGRRQ
jgi:Phospholipase_D-nuclease N-terminal